MTATNPINADTDMQHYPSLPNSSSEPPTDPSNAAAQPVLQRWDTIKKALADDAFFDSVRIAETKFQMSLLKIVKDATEKRQKSMNVYSKTSTLVKSGLLQRPALITLARKAKGNMSTIPPEIRAAAAKFDLQHRQSVQAAEDALRLTIGTESSLVNPALTAFRHRMSDVRRNRFFVDEGVEIFVQEDHTDKIKKPLQRDLSEGFHFNWHPRRSIFGDRKQGKHETMAGFYDTDDKYRACLELDWSIAVSQHFTRKYIEEDLGGSVEAVFDVLWENVFFVYGSYDFYATFGKSNDVVRIQVAAYRRLIADAGLEGPQTGLKSSDFQQLWKLLNSDTDDPSALNREQWLQCLVRFACLTYAKEDGATVQPAEALRRLFDNNLHPKVDRRALADISAFRDQFIYVQDVDELFRGVESSLRNLFTVYARGSGVMAAGSSTELLSYEEWHDMLIDLQLFGPDLTAREVSLTFVWSRMRVVDERKSAERLTQLSFDEFLEGIVRIAAFKVIPLDEEVDESGCADAGELMVQRMALPAAHQAAFIEAGMCDWDDPLPQPMVTLLEGLLTYIIRIVSSTIHGEAAVRKTINLNDAKSFKQSMEIKSASSSSKRDLLRRSLAPFMATAATEAASEARQLSDDEKLRAGLFGTVSGARAADPFALADADGGGTIDKAEFEALVASAGEEGQRLMELFNEVDKDGDGELTSEEIKGIRAQAAQFDP